MISMLVKRIVSQRVDILVCVRGRSLGWWKLNRLTIENGSITTTKDCSPESKSGSERYGSSHIMEFEVPKSDDRRPAEMMLESPVPEVTSFLHSSYHPQLPWRVEAAVTRRKTCMMKE